MPPQNDQIFKVVFFSLNIPIKFMYVFTTAPMVDASSMFSILLFYHPVWQKAQIIKVLNMQFSQVRCYCLPLGSKNSTWHSVFNILTLCLYTLLLRLPIPHSLFWALFYLVHHIHSKLTTFTPLLGDHKQYSRHLKYFIFCSKFEHWMQFVLVGRSSKTMCPELSYFFLITSCIFPTLIHFTHEYSTGSWDANLLLYSKFSTK